MKKSQSFFALLSFCLSFVLIPATDIAAMWDVPVAPGETFRWVFVTSGTTDATSSDISYYNEFVNHAADIVATPITGVLGKSNIAQIEWKAIASTESVYAIDNIGASPAGIYTPPSDLVATGTLDLFDGDILAPIMFTENVTLYSGQVWTGTNTQGRSDPLFSLGGAIFGASFYGYSDQFGPGWIKTGTDLQTEKYPVYAISEELSVVPVPGALILTATGLLSMLGLKRWRRKHQVPSQI